MIEMRVIKSSITFNSAILLIAALLFFAPSPAVFGQTNAERINATKQVDRSIEINGIEVQGESSSNAIDGSISIQIVDNNPRKSLYSVIYELHEKGNFQVVAGLSLVNGKVTIKNANNGNYFGFQVVREDNSKASTRYETLQRVQNGDLMSLKKGTNLRTQCSGTFTDCAGTTRTYSNLEAGNYYNSSSSFRPCGFYLDNNCNVSQNSQWHCIDGNLSAPSQFTEYSYAAVGYSEMNLTALQAARLNWIICNYEFDVSGVSAAVWYISGTGGSNNTIAQAAAAAVTTPDGSEDMMTFYKSSVSGVQDMIKWECQNGCQLTVSAGNDESICTSESVTLSASASNGTSPYTYFWSANGTQTTVQAESGSVGNGAAVESVQTGYNGSGYVEFFATNGEYLQVNVNVPTAGKYPVKFRVALSSNVVLNHELRINGTDVGDIGLQGTGSGNTWMVRDAGAYNLNAGNNTIRLTNINNDAVDVDEVIIGKKVTETNLYTVSPNSTTTYTVLAQDNNGCMATDHITVNVTSNCTDPIDEWGFECGDDKKVDEYGYNANCKTSTTAVIPSSSNVYQYVVELVYKGSNPGSTIQFTDATNTTYTLNRSVPVGGSSNIWVYRGLISGSTSSVTYTNSSYTCSLQSLVVYAFRNVPNAAASTGIFTNMSGYNDLTTITLDIPTDNGPRDLTIETPISEMTTDGRYLLLRADAGGITDQVILYGPDASLPGGTCCLVIPSLTLNNVPGNVTQVVITVDTRHNQNGQSVNGQSWVIASGVNVDVECFNCDWQADAGADKTSCEGQSVTLAATTNGGQSPFSYSWSNGAGNTASVTVTPTTTTVYTVTVTDDNGCEETDQVIVNVTPNLETSDGGIIANDETQCGGFDPEEIISVVDPSGFGCSFTPPNNNGGDCCDNGDKPTQFTLFYNGESCADSDNNQGSVGGKWDCNGDAQGDASVYIVVNDGQFEGMVNMNGLFTVSNLGEKLSNPIEVTIYDQQGGFILQYVEMHTSCSAPIVVGDQFGSLVLLATEFENGQNCGDGTGLSYQWEQKVGTGSWTNISGATGLTYDPSTITTTTCYRRKTFNCCDEVYSNEVCKTIEVADPGEIAGDESNCGSYDPTLITSVEDGSGECIDNNNGEDCCDIGGDRAFAFTLKYTGENCAASDNHQGNIGGKWDCSGDSQFDNNVYIVVNNKENALDGEVYFTGNVSINDDFTASALNANQNDLSSMVYIHIYNQQGGSEIQLVAIHASCSAPIVPGDQFGSMVLLFVEHKNGYECGVINQDITYQWQQKTSTGNWTDISGATATTYDPSTISETMQYRRQATNCCGTSASNIVTKTIHPDPIANAGPNKVICAGESVILSASGGGTYVWSTGQTTANITVSPTTTTTYTVTVTSDDGCTDTDQVKVTVNGIPTVNAGDDEISCNGESVSLTANTSYPGTVTYLWSTGATTQSITVSPSITTTYTVTAMSNKGCADSDDVTVTVQPSFSSGINAPDTRCAGEGILFSANPPISGATYSWSFTGSATPATSTDPSVIVEWNAEGTYTATLVVTKGACTATYTHNIVITQEVFAAAGPDHTICQGATVTLGGSPTGPSGADYLWTPNLFLDDNTSSNPSSTPPVTTTYTVQVTQNGCTRNESVTVNVDVNLNPKPEAGPNETVCIGSSVVIGSTSPLPGATYQWSTAAGDISGATNAQLSVSPTTETEYFVTVTNAEGCPGIDSTTVSVNPVPTFLVIDKACELFVSVYNVELTTNANQVVSSQGTVVNNGGNSWEIQDIPNGQNITITATITATGCETQQTVTSPNCLCPPVDPPAVSSGDQEICFGETIPTLTVTVGSFTSVNWFDAAIGGNLLASNTTSYIPTTAGTYYAEAYLPLFPGCVSDARTPVTLIINPLPNVSAGDDEILCNGDDVTLTATGAVSYVWSTGATTATITVSPTVNTTYTVTGTDANGCTNTDDANVTIQPRFTSGIDAPNSRCAGEGILFTANPAVPGATYSWTFTGPATPSASTDPSVIVEWSTEGTYTATLVVTKGACTETYTHNIIITQEVFAAAGPDRTICQGASTTIGGSPTGPSGADYLWTPNLFLDDNTTSNPTATPPVTITYTVQVTQNGCTRNESVTVNVDVNLNPKPEAGANQEICLGESVLIGSDGVLPGVTYQWSTAAGDIAGANTSQISVNPTTTTEYFVTAINADGCPGKDSTIVTVNPVPTANAGADATICSGASTQLSASASGGTAPHTYNWDNGLGNGANQTVSPTTTTTYTVTATDANGCTDTDEVTINVNASPTVDIEVEGGEPVVTCATQEVELDASVTGGTPAYTYLWNTGATTASIDVSPTVTTTYSVVVTDANGCQDEDEIVITVDGDACASLGDYVWEDLDTDGIQDGNESGIPGVKVYLKDATGTIIDSTVTVGNGFYEFTGLVPGTYSVQFGILPGYAYSPLDQGGNEALDSDADPAMNGMTATVTLVNGQNYPDLDAGIYKDCSVAITGGPASPICSEEEVTLTAAGNGGLPPYNYSWNTGATTASITVSPTSTTTYTVTVTDANGCESSTNVAVRVHPQPTVDAGPNQSTCGVEQVNLQATGTGGTPPYTYEWNNGVTTASQTVSPEVTTVYVVELTDANGCTTTDEVRITVNEEPIVNVGSDTAICDGESLTITAEAFGGLAPYSYLWNTGATSTSITVSPNTNTTYSVTVTDANGCANTDDIAVNVDPDFVSGMTGPSTRCAGEEMLFTVDPVVPGATYEWFFNGPATPATSTDASALVSWSEPGIYLATLEVTRGACKESYDQPINITQEIFAAAGPDQTICEGASVTIGGSPTGPAGADYLWTPNLFINNNTVANPTVTPPVTTTYTVAVTQNGCTNTESVTVFVDVDLNPKPIAGDDRESCSAELVTIGGPVDPSAFFYQWSTSAGDISGANSSLLDVNPTETTTYYVTAYNQLGCKGVDSVTITINPNPTVNVGGDLITCSSQEVTLTASTTGGTAGYTYLWNTGATTESITVNPTSTTSYSVVVTDSKGCTDEDNATITVDSDACASIGDYVWFDADTDGIQDGNESGVADVKVYLKDENGVIIDSTLTLADGSYEFTDLVPSTYSVQFVLPAGNVFSPLDQGGDDTADSDADATMMGMTTTVTLTNGQNYEDFDAGIYEDCSVAITGGPADPICVGDDVELTATGMGGLAPYTYAWSTGATTASITVSPTATTTYTVTITDANGCTSNGSVEVEVYAAPSVDAGDDQEGCSLEDRTLTAAGSGGQVPYTYEWSNGETTATITVNPEVSATYVVLLTDANGCEAIDTVEVIVNPLPIVNAGDDQSICESLSADLTATANGGTGSYTYLWSTGATTATITVSPTSTTEYTIVITDEKGCTATDTVEVEVYPAPSVDAGDDQEGCALENRMLTAAGSGGQAPYTYEWSTGATTATITVNPEVSATYVVLLTDANGCEAIDTVEVIVNPSPIVNLGDDIVTCENQSVEINAVVNGGTPGYTYLWSTGATTASITVSPLASANYSVVVTDSKGCTATDTVTVTVDVDACASIGDYVWFDADTDGIQDGNESGVADVKVYLKDENGVIIDSTLTLADGSYIFTGLVPGTYSVQFVLPAGNVFSPLDQGGDDAADSDADATMMGMTTTVTLTNGQNYEDFDAGIYEDCSVNVSGPADPICVGDDVELTAAGMGGLAPYTYTWNTGATTASITVSPTVTTTYTVTVTDANGCTSDGSVEVEVYPAVFVDAGDDQESCGLEDRTLTAVGSGGQAPYTYEWNNGVDGPTQTVNPEVTTSYVVLVIDANGCEAIDTVDIIVNPTPIPPVPTADITCIGDTIKLFANVTATSYAWTGPNNFTSSEANPIIADAELGDTGTYVLVITNDFGCSIDSSVEVKVAELPVITVITSSSCNADLQSYFSVFMVNEGDVSVNAGILSEQNGTYTADSIPVGTNLMVTVTSEFGCVSTKEFASPNCPCPEVGMPNGVDEVEACSNKPLPTLVVFVNPGSTADWYTVPNGGTPIAEGTTSYKPTTPGVYYVGERALVSGCESAQRLRITVIEVECDDCGTPDCLEIGIDR